MKAIMMAIGLALLPQAVAAQPPTEGTTHTFVDPVFVGTVFCDTYYEVLAIATAVEPDKVYARFLKMRNDVDEPACAAIAPTGIVVDVRPLGVMLREGKRYDAWAVETKVGQAVGFALYLEKRNDIIA